MSSGNKEVIKMARQAHPASSELWLAELAAKIRDGGPGDWVLPEITQIAENQNFPAGTMTRAGELLLRSGMTNAASIAAAYAIKHAYGLLPAYVLGLQCAFAKRDKDLALKCAAQAAEHALDPTPFEKTIVELQMSGRPTADLTAMINRLRAKFPDDPQWSERLGLVNFQNNDMAAAISVLVPMIEKGLMSQMSGMSVLMAAEATRIEGHNDKAIEILEKAHASNPNDVVMLNNLIYCLALKPGGLPRAQLLLPKLLSLKMECAPVFDTAATVYFKAGKIEQAGEFTRKALKVLRPNENALDDIHLNAAEVFICLGEFKEARAELDIVRQIGKRSRCSEERRQALVASMEKR